MKDGGDGLAFIKYKDGRSAIYPLGNSCFWHAGKDLYFRQSYNDTIYRVSAAKELQPVRVLDLGVYSWSYNERFEDKKDAIYPTKFMENEDVILFRFMTNVYNDKQKTYNALYLSPLRANLLPFSLRKKSSPGSRITPVKRISLPKWPP